MFTSLTAIATALASYIVGDLAGLTVAKVVPALAMKMAAKALPALVKKMHDAPHMTPADLAAATKAAHEAGNAAHVSTLNGWVPKGF